MRYVLLLGYIETIYIPKVLLEMEQVLTNMWSPFNSTQEERWKDMNKKLNRTMTGLGISEVEKKEVVAAMGLSSGHWYTCPAGHVYAIGDCGGAAVESTCPECGARYGKGRLQETTAR